MLLVSLLLVTAFAADPQGPHSFVVAFITDVQVPHPSSPSGTSPGVITLNITRHSAPRGSDRFWALLQDDFFDQAAFFRVVPNFIVQFGVAGDPRKTKKWDITIPDDPVLMSNDAGTIVYATAGPNTRTTQLFINYENNKNLDTQGFAPFGRVLSGMDVAAKIFNPTPGDSGGADQTTYTNRGNAWLKDVYPKANYILKAEVKGEDWNPSGDVGRKILRRRD